MWPVISLKLDDHWLPKSVICLRDYSLNKFLKDVIAGVTVGLVAALLRAEAVFEKIEAEAAVGAK